MRKLLRDTILAYDFIAFKECNNNCTFCFQKNTDNIKFTNPEDVLKRFDLIVEDIKKKYNKYNEVQIDFTGGELFFRQGLEDMYFKIFDKIESLKQQIQIPIRCLIGTNLLYSDTTLLYNVLNYIMQLDKQLLRGIFTSYDFSGRFLSIDKVVLHKKNTLDLLKYTKDKNIYFALISVLTKEAIQKFLTPDDDLSKFIKKTYDEYYQISQDYIDLKHQDWKFRLSWTLMSPNSIDPEYTKKMVPSANDIYEFYKHLVDNYGTLAIIEAFRSKNLALRCGNSCNVCKKDIIEKSCDSNIYGSELLSPENLHVKSNDPIDIYRWLISKYDCMTCKYFKHCYLRPCPVVVNLKTVEVGDFCWRKKIYEYVDSKQTSK